MVTPNDARSQAEKMMIQRTLPCFDELFAWLAERYARTQYRHKPIMQINRYSGSSKADQTLVEWKVNANCIYGELIELSITTDDFTNTKFGVILGDINLTEKQIQVTYNAPFKGLKLAPNEVVKVTAHSDGTNSINTDGALIAIEYY